MDNYPNINHDLNQNALAALQTVLSSMQDDGEFFLRELSESELRTFNKLYRACEEFIRQTNTMR